MARERNNKEVKTHLEMVKIYDKGIEDYFKKHGIRLTYTQITKIVSTKINSVGGLKI